MTGVPVIQDAEVDAALPDWVREGTQALVKV